MTNYFTPRLLLALVLAAFSGLGVSGQDEERPIWEQEVMLVYSARSTEFNRLRTIGKENKRLSLYTTALDTLHGKVPVEEDEKPYQVAQRIFRMIIADNDSDAIGLAAAYYNARVTQSNPYEQDIAEAKKLYWKLYEKWPERFFGQMAFVKYATLHIYDDDGSGDEVWERIQNLEPIVSDISIPELRQNVHRIMGEAYFSFDLDSTLAYEHLTEAYRLGIPVGSIRVEVLERIAALGEELGENERALSAYDELVRSAPRHERRSEFVAAAERLRSGLVKSAGK
ncbi:hypothetical protein [Pelagicoccus sp. SDUM812005]|uniref:hypothetical protein n=1 Tax=Pelagicoccus sp. SDUM812005 TaxID=3041257 RepID=UPI00280FC216|nr:hypothetical protein [Pelagicoccus sp. SDUM812005]MDQ8179733.1 hypothetical protein [Pelagicoccus sp. SDUM812005]